MEKGSLKQLAVYGLGIQLVMLTMPIWIPFAIIYCVLEFFLGPLKGKISRVEAVGIVVMILCALKILEGVLKCIQ